MCASFHATATIPLRVADDGLDPRLAGRAGVVSPPESRFYYREAGGWFIYPLILLAFTSIPASPFVLLAAALFVVFPGGDPGPALEEIGG